jgi:hypothetical protein
LNAVILAQAARPDSADFWLFLHILGGMAAIGALTLSFVSFAVAWRGGSAPLTRLGFRSLLWAAIPAYLVLRISAQVLLDEEGLDDADLAWIDIGFIVTEPGSLLLIVATLLGGLAARQGAGPSVKARVATGLVGVLLIAYLIAVWAMTTQPA